jgi:hypothetical protein
MVITNPVAYFGQFKSNNAAATEHQARGRATCPRNWENSSEFIHVAVIQMQASEIQTKIMNIPAFFAVVRVQQADPVVIGIPQRKMIHVVNAKCSVRKAGIEITASSQIVKRSIEYTMQMRTPMVEPMGRNLGFSSNLIARSMNAALNPVAMAEASSRKRMVEFTGTKTAVIPVKAAKASERYKTLIANWR